MTIEEQGDGASPPGESTPLLLSKSGSGDGGATDKRGAMQSFRRKSIAKISSASAASQQKLYQSLRTIEGAKLLTDEDEVPTASPVEGLAPLFPNGGIVAYDGRDYVPYREASLLKSIPPYAPYRRKARHRSFYLWWTNVS